MQANDTFAVTCIRRGEALRIFASDVKDAATKHAMLQWADDYDRLAHRAIEIGVFDAAVRTTGITPQNRRRAC